MKRSGLFARRFGVLAMAGVFVVLAGNSLAWGQAEARSLLRKDEAVSVDWRHRGDVVWVKFLDDLPIRAIDGVLVIEGVEDALGETRAAVPLMDAGSWRAAHSLEPERLETARRRAETALGRSIADPRSEFHFWLPEGVTPREAIDAFNALDVVELALPVQVPTPSPRAGGGDRSGLTPPNFEGMQGYLEASPVGIGATEVWQSKGVRGAGVRVADIEYDFNADHADLPGVTVLTVGTPTQPFSNDHGTAVLGQLGSLDNGWGTTGIAHEADLYFSHSSVNGVLNIASAIYRCVNEFEPGDVILVEAQMWGPNSVNFPPDCFGCVPVEWSFSTYNAILIAVGNGIHVVLTGGNGQQNLDDPVYTQGNAGHWPFVEGADSGAIMVGAGHAPSSFGGSGVARSRVWYSNHGSRFNLQGWGEAIWTTGYGSSYDSMGQNYWYTSSFGGTSGAGPIVTGAVALLESYHQSALGTPMEPLTLRELLEQTGAAQANGQYPATQKIGVLPDVLAAIEAVDAPHACPGDVDGNGEIDLDDLNLVLTNFGQATTIGDATGDGIVDLDDLNAVLTAFGTVCSG